MEVGINHPLANSRQNGLGSARGLSDLFGPFARLSPGKAVFHAGGGSGRFLGATGLAEFEISITLLALPKPAFPWPPLASIIPFVVLANTVLEDFMLMKGFLD